MAKLYFYYSSMNAGKSTSLLQSAYNYKERGMRPFVLSAAIDDRYSVGKVTSRIGLDTKYSLGKMIKIGLTVYLLMKVNFYLGSKSCNLHRSLII